VAAFKYLCAADCAIEVEGWGLSEAVPAKPRTAFEGV